MIKVQHLYLSPGHNFVGHHGGLAGTHLILEVDEIQCVAGRGVSGDRYFDHKENYKGQITFFSYEVYADLCQALQIHDKAPSAFRRNVILSGIDLNSWVGEKFQIQGVEFFGTEVCQPCYWMDQAFGAGAEKWLKDRGGLRAQILTSGVLKKI